jgi:hypothetical protein
MIANGLFKPNLTTVLGWNADEANLFSFLYNNVSFAPVSETNYNQVLTSSTQLWGADAVALALSTYPFSSSNPSQNLWNLGKPLAGNFLFSACFCF